MSQCSVLSNLGCQNNLLYLFVSSWNPWIFSMFSVSWTDLISFCWRSRSNIIRMSSERYQGFNFQKSSHYAWSSQNVGRNSKFQVPKINLLSPKISSIKWQKSFKFCQSWKNCNLPIYMVLTSTCSSVYFFSRCSLCFFNMSVSSSNL